MALHHIYEGTIDTVEWEDDRVTVRLLDRPGFCWVRLAQEELISTLRRAQQRGNRVEVTFDPRDFQIADVIDRGPR